MLINILLGLDDKSLFSDLQMNPTELATILHRRRRRNVKLMDPLNQRRKRSLSSYDLYSSESVHFTSSFIDVFVVVVDRRSTCERQRDRGRSTRK